MRFLSFSMIAGYVLRMRGITTNNRFVVDVRSRVEISMVEAAKLTSRWREGVEWRCGCELQCEFSRVQIL